MKYSLEIYYNYTLEDWILDSDYQSYVLGNDPDSFDQWEQFFNENPQLRSTAEEAKEILLGLNQPTFSLDKNEVNDLWFGIQDQIKPQSLRVAKVWPKSWLLQGSIAAVLVLGMLGVFFWMFLPAKSIEYATGYGETIHLFLPDSSEVTLNSNSRLVYSGNWDQTGRREVKLSGEAFFKVRHLKDHRPFAVLPKDGIEIEVLGTSFNVYERRDETRVVLSEGKVALKFPRSTQDLIEMKPGDLVEVSQEKISRRTVDTDKYTSWTQQVLTLDKTSLQEIIQIAEENFGLKVVVASEVPLDQTASGSVPLTDGDQFMNLISRVFNFTVEEKNSIYYIQ